MPNLPFASSVKPAKDLLTQLIRVAPKEAKFSLGVDIGSSSVKALALGPRKPGGRRQILGQHTVTLGSGRDVDPSDAIKQAVEALHPPVHTVTIGVSGPWVIMRAVEMPTMKPAEMKQALPFEAQRYLPFNVQEVVIDGAILGPADANKTWVLIVACKKDLIERRMDALKRAGLDAAVIDVDALALANAHVQGANGQDGTRALVNVGAQFTNLVILRWATPYLVRDVPWGGEKFYRGIAEQAGQEAAAIESKLREGSAGAEFADAVKLALEPLIAELQLSFDYFENRFGQPPEGLLVSGGLSLSPGFLEGVKGQLTQSVTRWAPAEELSPQYTVAYGLALRSAG